MEPHLPPLWLGRGSILEEVSDLISLVGLGFDTKHILKPLAFVAAANPLITRGNFLPNTFLRPGVH